MKPFVRNIIITVLLTAIVVTFHIVRRNSTMRGIEISISDGCKNNLLDDGEIENLILGHYPGLEQTDIKEVDTKGIVELLSGNPYVLTAKAHMSMGGKLQVSVTLRDPVVRMFYQDNEFYISRQGTYMPLTASHYSHVIVGSCGFEEPHCRNIHLLNLSDTSLHKQPFTLRKIWTLASFLYDNPQYGDIFDQISVEDKGDLFLVPKLGNLTVIVGDTSQLDKKFENMWAFLDQGINQVGWDTYSTINLKFNNQVVCSRK